MNTNLKLLIGATIGAGLGYFVGSIIVEIIALKEHPEDELDYYDLEYPNTQDGGPEIDEEKKLFQRSEPMSKRRTRNYTQAFQGNPGLELLVKKYNGELELPDLPIKNAPAREEEEIEGLHDPEEEDDDIQPISIISMAEFANAEGFECLTLKYYEDDVVTDEHDTPIDRPEEILGEDALVSFGELSGDEDTVYVRNLPKKAMYEVIRTGKNYSVQKVRRERREAVARMRAAQKEEDDGEENT